MRRLVCVLTVLLVVGQAANACEKEPNEAEYPRDPNELLRVKWGAVVSVLQNKELDQKAKEKEVGKIVSPIFDFPLMAKLALGKRHWPKLSGAEREKFTELFVERLKSSYQEKISLYRDEEVLFKPAVRKNSTIQIPMVLVSSDKEVAILYKLRQVEERRKVKVGEKKWKVKVDKRWKVYDVEIQGVSILLTYRSQFDDILRKGTVKDLLARLERPVTP